MILKKITTRPVSPRQIERHFTITALVGTVIAIILLTLLFREMFTSEIITIGERNNVVLTKTALNVTRPALVKYLESVKSLDGNKQHIPPLPLELKDSLINAMDDIDATRINIYNRHGIIIYSTAPDKIGQYEANNPRFKYAISGRVASKLSYRDHLNIFESEDKDNNLVETYLPISDHHASTISGVMEIYTDVSDMVSQAERTRLITIIGVLIIMALLYSFQVFTVRRAASVIEEQQQTLRERSRTLEVLSAQIMNADESDRKRIAIDLHEDVAQTLSAAKVYLERASQLQKSNDSASSGEPLQKTIDILQDAIQDVRDLAMELRPTTLDEYGLVKTIDWICSQFSELNNIELETRIEVTDEDVPAALTTIIYRVIKESLASIARHGQATKVSLHVSRQDNNLLLMMEDNAVAYHSEHDSQTEQNVALAAIRERIILSGGSFKLASNHHGGTVITGEWPC